MPPDTERLRLERDLFLRLLELGARDDLRPFLEDALALIVEATGAQQGYIELARSRRRGRPGAPRSGSRSGFTEAELARRAPRGLDRHHRRGDRHGRTISTASAVEDPRFRAQESVQAQRIRAVLCAPIGGRRRTRRALPRRPRRAGPFPRGGPRSAPRSSRATWPRSPIASSRARRRRRRPDHTAELRARLARGRRSPARSRALAEVLRQVLVAAPVPIAVLVTGESGTGKTAIARALHESSPRARGPFVEVNCAAIPEALFESELFGAEKGAHSTATRRIDGKVDAAKRWHAVPRRGRRDPARGAGQAAHVPAEPALLPPRRQRPPSKPTCASSPPRTPNLEELVRAEALPRGPLLPAQRARRCACRRCASAARTSAPIAEAHRARASARPTAGPSPLSRAARMALAESEWPGNVRQLENAMQRGWAVALSEEADGHRAARTSSPTAPRRAPTPGPSPSRRPTRTRRGASRHASCERRSRPRDGT